MYVVNCFLENQKKNGRYEVGGRSLCFDCINKGLSNSNEMTLDVILC